LIVVNIAPASLMLINPEHGMVTAFEVNLINFELDVGMRPANLIAIVPIDENVTPHGERLGAFAILQYVSFELLELLRQKRRNARLKFWVDPNFQCLAPRVVVRIAAALFDIAGNQSGLKKGFVCRLVILPFVT
jgi:hypothetical protein